MRRRDLSAACAFKLETKTSRPPEKFPVAAAAALTLLALVLRLAYAWRLGVPPPVGAVVASAAAGLALAAVAVRVGGRFAGAAAAFIWATLPAAVVASIFRAEVTYAACAASFSLYFFGEGVNRPGRASDALWSGALAGAAVAFSSSALVIVAYYLLFSLYSALRKNGAGARALVWLGGFAPVIAAAAGLEYLRAREPLAHLKGSLAAPASSYPELALLVKRLVPDAAAMLFWDPLGFGFAVVVALAASAYLLKARRTDAFFYGGLLVFGLAAFNFMTTSLRSYAPTTLEPTVWLLVALPAAALAGAAAGELWESGVKPSLGQWAGALAVVFVLAALFVNGNMPFAPLSLLISTLAVIITITLAGLARRRRDASPRRLAQGAVAIIILISLYSVVILYL